MKRIAVSRDGLLPGEEGFEVVETKRVRMANVGLLRAVPRRIKNSFNIHVRFRTWKYRQATLLAIPPPLGAYYAPTIWKKPPISGLSKLEAIENTLRSMFPEGRYIFQLRLHQQILRAILRPILGDSYDREVKSVCKRYQWDGPKKNAIVLASRRSGKTTGITSMMASLLLHVYKMSIVCFAAGMRTAKESVRLTEGYVFMIKDGARRILKQGAAQRLVIRGTSPIDQRTVTSLPSCGVAASVSSPPALPQCAHAYTYT